MSKFKTIEWVRQTRDKNYEETKHLDKKELLEFYKKKAEAARNKLKICKVAQ